MHAEHCVLHSCLQKRAGQWPLLLGAGALSLVGGQELEPAPAGQEEQLCPLPATPPLPPAPPSAHEASLLCAICHPQRDGAGGGAASSDYTRPDYQ